MHALCNDDVFYGKIKTLYYICELLAKIYLYIWQEN